MISKFENEYKFLNNFYNSNVLTYKGKDYPTAEHLFQALKTDDINHRNRIRRLDTPAQAKRFGQTVTLRDDWEQIKDDIMLLVVQLKFTQNPGLMAWLKETGNTELVEGNWWHDNYWGNCICSKCKKIEGLNQLGKTLMKVREGVIK